MTYKKIYVGMGLFVQCLYALSLHLVAVVFGTAIPTSLYIFGKCFIYFICSLCGFWHCHPYIPQHFLENVFYTCLCAFLFYHSIIRESVDSLCRDGADTPIVRLHRKAFLTHERSRSKPFWAPSYSIPAFLYPTIPPK